MCLRDRAHSAKVQEYALPVKDRAAHIAGIRIFCPEYTAESVLANAPHARELARHNSVIATPNP